MTLLVEQVQNVLDTSTFNKMCFKWDTIKNKIVQYRAYKPLFILSEMWRCQTIIL